MLFLLVVVLVVLAVRKASQPKKQKTVDLAYPGGVGRLVGSNIVFPCGCRFHIGSQDRRLCASHDAILSAEARA